MINKNKKNRIYLDHAAATYLSPRVKQAMEPFWEEEFGNASSLYREGRRAKFALEDARFKIASLLGTFSDEIIFTSGGTEGDNLAIFGAARAYQRFGKHIITTNIEHPAVLKSLRELEKEGFEVTYLNVDKQGIINIRDFEKALRLDTILVSVMYANNEIGTIQPISEISKIIKKYRKNGMPVLHTDACQAAGYLDMNVKKLGVDLMVANGSKIYGPKGVGFLYKKRGVELLPLVYGGEQEGRLRAGTENIPAIIGLAKAFEIAQKERIKESKRISGLRDALIAGILKEIPKVVLNGHPKKRLPNNVNVSILDIEGESIVLYLDKYGIACSTGSACTSTNLEPSHVILALGKPYEFAHASVRFSLGRRNTMKDVCYVLNILPKITGDLRKISPLNIKESSEQISHPELFAGKNIKREGLRYR